MSLLIYVDEESLVSDFMRKRHKQTLLCTYHILTNEKIGFFQQVARHNAEKFVLEVVANGLFHVGVQQFVDEKKIDVILNFKL